MILYLSVGFFVSIVMIIATLKIFGKPTDNEEWGAASALFLVGMLAYPLVLILGLLFLFVKYVLGKFV